MFSGILSEGRGLIVFKAVDILQISKIVSRANHPLGNIRGLPPLGFASPR
jgi:hypothetical protein